MRKVFTAFYPTFVVYSIWRLCDDQLVVQKWLLYEKELKWSVIENDQNIVAHYEIAQNSACLYALCQRITCFWTNLGPNLRNLPLSCNWDQDDLITVLSILLGNALQVVNIGTDLHVVPFFSNSSIII